MKPINHLLIFIFSTVLFLPSPVLSESKELPPAVAIVAPVSGNWAPYGVEIVRGAELAISGLEKEVGPIKLVVEDACLSADAVRSVQKLIAVDKIKALVGNYCVLGLVPTAPILVKNKVITFHSSAASDEIIAAGDFVFTTNITIKNESEALANYAYQELGAKKASVILVESQWGENYGKYFEQSFKKLGGEFLSTQATRVGVVDFRTEILKALKNKPDVILAVHVGADLGALIKQLRQAKFTGVILGPHESEEPTVIEGAGSFSEGLTMLSPELPKDGAHVLKFRESYRKRFQQEPGVLAANAFDSTEIALRFLHACKFDAECAKDKVYSLKDYPGVSGTLSITPEGGTIKSFVVKKVEGGVFKEFGKPK